jgi:hypothetical protein
MKLPNFSHKKSFSDIKNLVICGQKRPWEYFKRLTEQYILIRIA